MSLQIWLPLNGNLDNQGLNNLSFTAVSSNTSINSAGKTGSCYQNDSNSSGGLLSNTAIDLGQNQSMFCWFKFTSLESSSSLGGGLVSQHRYSKNTGMGITIKYVSSTTGYLSVNTGNGSSRTYNTYYGTTLLQANVWYHGGYTYDGSQIKIYVNGACEKTQSYTGMSVPSDYITCFCWSMSGNSGNSIHGDYKLKGCLNDVRVYNHCLSPLEVKQISQGLVLHYPLNNGGCGPSNLVKNGFGELGSENWSNSSNISTTEIPSGQSDIKASFWENTTKEHIKIYSNHNYKISLWIKAKGTASVTYPSLLPYDVDKKFINHSNCTDGFNLNTMTTLKQQLKSGDTKIYVNDLSQWNANSGHHFNSVAIFSYTDSTGYTYPDGTYTQNCPRFCSGASAKTNLDKTNNVVTLSSAYSGPTMPIGTKVCATTDGNVYYYPFGGISLSSIQDWTYKETIISSNAARLKYAKTIYYYTWDSNYTAGIKIQDSTVGSLNNDNIEYDCSGFGNNGEYYAYDSNGSISYISDTPRYDVSTHISSTNPTKSEASGTRYLYGHCSLTNPTQMTVAFWLKPVTYGYGGNNHGWFSTTNAQCGANAATDYQNSAMNHRDSAVDINDSASSTQCRPSFTATVGEWHHYAVTYDGQVGRVYKDGTLFSSAQFSEPKTLDSFIGVVIGFSKAGGVWRRNDAYYSDFRVYATALSAQDIQNLYCLGAAIDSSNNLYTYQLNET